MLIEIRKIDYSDSIITMEVINQKILKSISRIIVKDEDDSFDIDFSVNNAQLAMGITNQLKELPNKRYDILVLVDNQWGKLSCKELLKEPGDKRYFVDGEVEKKNAVVYISLVGELRFANLSKRILLKSAMNTGDYLITEFKTRDEATYMFSFQKGKRIKVMDVFLVSRTRFIKIPLQFKQQLHRVTFTIDAQTKKQLPETVQRYDLLIHYYDKNGVWQARFLQKHQYDNIPKWKRYFRSFNLFEDSNIKGRFYINEGGRMSFLTRNVLMTDKSERGVVEANRIDRVIETTEAILFDLSLLPLVPETVGEIKTVALRVNGNGKESMVEGKILSCKQHRRKVQVQVSFKKKLVSNMLVGHSYRLEVQAENENCLIHQPISELSEEVFDYFSALERNELRLNEERKMIPQLSATKEFMLKLVEIDEILDSVAVMNREKQAIEKHVINAANYGVDDSAPIILFEKHASYAQDNAFALFEYVMNQLQDEKHRFYYIMDPRSSQAIKVKQYEEQVLWLYSEKYYEYVLKAALFVSSDYIRHAYHVDRIFNPVFNIIQNKPFFMLQHGVTGMKKISDLWKYGEGNIDSFVVTNSLERQIVHDYLHYPYEKIAQLGFTRWDKLERKEATQRVSSVLFFPTWRPWLKESEEAEFIQSDYFLHIKALLDHPKLIECIDKHNIDFTICLHPFMEKFTDSLSSKHPQFTITSSANSDIGALIKEKDLVISDYSSVAWDFAYQYKPVVLYQFDKEKYLAEVGAFMDLDDNPLGEAFTECDAAVAKIIEFIENGCSPEAVQKTKELFSIEGSICQATYEYADLLTKTISDKWTITYPHLKEFRKQKIGERLSSVLLKDVE